MTRALEVWSVTKSIVSALIGIALVVRLSTRPDGQVPAESGELTPQPKEIKETILARWLPIRSLTQGRVWGQEVSEGARVRPPECDSRYYLGHVVRLKGRKSYYTLFNHGGPHVDAPVHMGFGLKVAWIVTKSNHSQGR